MMTRALAAASTRYRKLVLCERSLLHLPTTHLGFSDAPDTQSAFGAGGYSLATTKI